MIKLITELTSLGKEAELQNQQLRNILSYYRTSSESQIQKVRKLPISDPNLDETLALTSRYKRSKIKGKSERKNSLKASKEKKSKHKADFKGLSLLRSSQGQKTISKCSSCRVIREEKTQRFFEMKKRGNMSKEKGFHPKPVMRALNSTLKSSLHKERKRLQL